MLGACSGQSVSAPSQTSGTNAGGAAGAPVAVGSNASGSGGLPGDGGGGSSVGGAGAGGAATAMAGAAGSSANKPGCPASVAEVFPVSGATPMCKEEDLTCELPIACSSGAQLLSVTCKYRRWEVGAVGCNKPYDFCLATAGDNGSNVPGVHCEREKWVVDARGSSQPKPCPAQPPAEALPCNQGSGDYFIYDHCGYPCPSDPTKWTVFACTNPPTYLGPIAWFSDEACD